MADSPALTAWLRNAANQWIAEDFDPDSRAELTAIVTAAEGGSASAIEELHDRISSSLTFGTAGLRGPLRAGANGMNRAVVVRTTAGLATWLRQHAAGSDATGVVVVGYDARHGSEQFAMDAADVLAACGFTVHMLPEALPTPVLAYATRNLRAVAGVQITASHNPPQDNGYKVYLHPGTQLADPADTEIEAAISRVGPAVDVPRLRSWTPYERVLNDYLAGVETLPRCRSRQLRVAATALHGVGAQPLRYALHLAGFTDVHLVPSQSEPDADFPTVEFPNPEEPGATDALLETATEVDADLAIALDPDADRCAVGCPDPDGTWRMLHGDETGALLGEHILSTLDRARHPDPLVATTVVSATMLKSIAAEHGARYDETLTGFKWLVRAGDGAGTGLVYAYEEALGHCVDPDRVRDKDGIATAVLACDLAAGLKTAGRSLPELLDELATKHGVHETSQVSLRVDDLAAIDSTMRRLRGQSPAELAGVKVDVRDMLPTADLLVFEGATEHGNIRVVVRPSGTEPKLKCYLQVVETVHAIASTAASGGSDDADGHGALAAAKARARTRLSRLHADVSAQIFRVNGSFGQ